MALRLKKSFHRFATSLTVLIAAVYTLRRLQLTDNVPWPEQAPRVDDASVARKRWRGMPGASPCPSTIAPTPSIVSFLRARSTMLRGDALPRTPCSLCAHTCTRTIPLQAFVLN